MRSAPFDKPTDQMIETASWMLWREGFRFASAWLSGVRLVRVSTGLADRSRRTQHTSGIQLEYEDDLEDTILGQWMEDLGSLPLAADEFIVGIAIWSEVEPNRRPSHRRIVGIELETSISEWHKFCPGTDNNSEIREYRHGTPHEKLVSSVSPVAGALGSKILTTS